MSTPVEFTDNDVGTKARGWFLTINNPASTDLVQLPGEVYVVWQLEEGKNKTPHLQVSLYFRNAVSFNSIKKAYPTANISRTRQLQQSFDYCSKDEGRLDGPWERGTRPRQGNRTDIHEAVECLKRNVGSKRPFEEVALCHGSVAVRMHKGLQFLANEFVQERNETPEVIVLYGSTGKNKTRYAKTWLPEAWEWRPSMKDWFDGYLGHKEAIFDEFRGQLDYGTMLSVLDRYTHSHQVKGGMIKFVATKIAITSPKHPREWYPRQCEKTDSINQLLRRITKVINLDEETPWEFDDDDKRPPPDSFEKLAQSKRTGGTRGIASYFLV